MTNRTLADSSPGQERTPTATIRSRIGRNTDLWGLSQAAGVVLFLAPLVPLPLVVFLAAVEHPMFYDVTVEDGLIEWLQVGLLVVAGGAYLALAARLRSTGRRLSVVLLAFVGVAALVVAGEEISWGQRLLGLATPAELEVINHQGELNIHNINAVEFLNRLGQFAASGYATLVPIVALAPSVAGRVTERYLVPPVAMTTWFAIPFAYWLIRLPIEPARAMRRFSEFPELTLYGGLALLGLLSLRRLSSLLGRNE